MRVAVVTPIPTPYRDRFWNDFAKQPGVDLTVFYCSAGKADRPWTVNWSREFRSEVIPGSNLLSWRSADASCYWNPSIARRLRELAPDVLLVGGYNHLTMWSAMRQAKRLNIPYLLMCETYRRDHGRGLKPLLKQRLVGWAVRNAAGVLPTGSLAEKYLQDFGSLPKLSVRFPNVPDVEALHDASQHLRQSREEVRGRQGLSNAPVVLFVGRLIPKKRASLLIRAFARADGSAQLVIVGDGPEKPALVAMAKHLGLEDRIHFPGFVQPQDIAAWYATADLFVLPSSETWGVVVLEALASGLPVILSDEVGCHPDVLTDPRDGTVVRAGDEDALATAIRDRLTSVHRGREAPAASIWSSRREHFAVQALALRLYQGLEGVVKNFHSNR